MKVSDPKDVPGLTAKIKRLQERQGVEWNRHRELHIGRLKLRLAATAAKTGDAVNLDSTNSNLCELVFSQVAAQDGWSLIKRGWPDFLCWRGEEVIFVEVKPDGGTLSEYQVIVMEKLCSLGLKCYKWTPSGGYQPLFKEPAKVA